MRICFVCLGNICRSPTAEGIMTHLVGERGLADRIEIDSAGTGDYQIGKPPDTRAVAEARARGVDLQGQARQIRSSDFEAFDLLVAMDGRNLADLQRLAPEHLRERVVLLRSFDPASSGLDGHAIDVPDPYMGRANGFATVYDLIEAACRGLLDHIVATELA